MTTPLYRGATELEDRAIRTIVGLAMDAPAAAKSGHPGTAMALAPLGVMLFSRVAQHVPTDPSWHNRDRFILSCGHASILQYGLAHVFGYDVSTEDLRAFRQLGSRTPGHPENGVTPTVEVTTGPLGQGIANGVGMALAERILADQHGTDLVNHRTWIIAGDGCLEEGISHEAASLAGSLQLDKLTVFYDDNHITIDGDTSLALRDDTAARFLSYGWQVINAGDVATDLDALESATREAMSDTSRPSLIIVRSHIGYPAAAMTDTREAHGSPFSAAVITETKSLLGIEDVPFALDETLPPVLSASLQVGPRAHNAWLALPQTRRDALDAQMVSSGGLREEVEIAPYTDGSVATRKAMQRVTDTIGPSAPGFTMGSADLTENTGAYFPARGVQSFGTPGGRQIYYGIREFAMGAILVGQALHGGIRPAGSTFFVFSDYMRSAIRMAALSHAPALFVFTHDSIGVGEDGPTHQPIEHLASLRAIPRLHVVRPSDANETLNLLHDFYTDPHPPATAVVLTRQDVPVLTGSHAQASQNGARRGGYVLEENAAARVTFVGTGSEVGVLLEASRRLADEGVFVRVVALPCTRCFDEQDDEYRHSVLRRGDIPSVSLEAGATLGWYKYVDHAIGIDDFGVSAPGAKVFEHFGITPERMVSYVKENFA